MFLLGENFTNLANRRFKKTSQAALDLNLVRRPNSANLNSQTEFCAGQNSAAIKNPPQSLNLIKNQTAPFVPNLPQITASSESPGLLGRQDFATKKLELNLTSHRLAQAVLNFSQNANLIGKLNFLRAASLRSNLIRRANFINVAKEFKNESVMAFVLNSAQGRVGADLNLQSNFNPTKKSEPNLSQTASFGLNSAQRPNFSPNANRSKKQISSFVPNLPLVLALNENPNLPQKPVLSKARNV